MKHLSIAPALLLGTLLCTYRNYVQAALPEIDLTKDPKASIEHTPDFRSALQVTQSNVARTLWPNTHTQGKKELAAPVITQEITALYQGYILPLFKNRRIEKDSREALQWVNALRIAQSDQWPKTASELIEPHVKHLCDCYVDAFINNRQELSNVGVLLSEVASELAHMPQSLSHTLIEHIGHVKAAAGSIKLYITQSTRNPGAPSLVILRTNIPTLLRKIPEPLSAKLNDKFIVAQIYEAKKMNAPERGRELIKSIKNPEIRQDAQDFLNGSKTRIALPWQMGKA
ncbi:MAG: hypothetical protein WCW33_05120 [Candidatus Babeliales bacterium]|jgi:hypothetical protein